MLHQVTFLHEHIVWETLKPKPRTVPATRTLKPIGGDDHFSHQNQEFSALLKLGAPLSEGHQCVCGEEPFSHRNRPRYVFRSAEMIPEVYARALE